jgi:2',3'-cyclic-nucleotide 2'-phosphodiesterase (5'-nucleotidase family)
MCRRLFALGLCVILSAGISTSAIAKELVILHTNDTHSNLFPFGPHDQYGGIARMSTLIKKLRSENDNVLALHAGDAFVGTFAFNKYLGYPELKIMEGLYDAMALGNHEFDLGPVVLGYILAGFNPITRQPLGDPVTLPILAANVDVGSIPLLGAFVRPWTIKEIGGVKVGLLGVVTSEPVYYSPDFVGIFGDPYAAAGLAALELRKQPGCCDVVVAVSHLGLAFDVLGLSEVPGIDVIVSSHSHDEFFAPNIKGKVIVQAGAFGKNLGELRITIDDATKAITNASHVLHRITEKIHKDPALLPYLNALREGIYADPRYGPVYSQHVAKALWDLEEEWVEGDPQRQPSHRDTPLGNLVADAIREGVAKAGYSVDLALEANGYIGHKIYEGKVVGNDVMLAVPYGYDPVSGLGFKLKAVSLYGAELLAGLEYTVSMVEYTEDFSLQVSGLKFAYDSTRPVYNRVDLASVKINGQPLNPYGLYRIALNEKLLELLAGLGLDLTGRIVNPSPDLLEFKIVKEYMNEVNHLQYTSEGRVIDTAPQP